MVAQAADVALLLPLLLMTVQLLPLLLHAYCTLQAREEQGKFVLLPVMAHVATEVGRNVKRCACWPCMRTALHMEDTWSVLMACCLAEGACWHSCWRLLGPWP